MSKKFDISFSEFCQIKKYKFDFSKNYDIRAENFRMKYPDIPSNN